MAAMRSADGPFGPGLRRRQREEKSRRYLRSTSALWNLNSVAGLMSVPTFGIPARTHQQRGQSDYHAIAGGEIRCAMAGPITDKQLMLQRQGLRDDGTRTTWTEQLCEGHQHMDGKDQEVARGANRIMADGARKTAPHRRIPSYC